MSSLIGSLVGSLAGGLKPIKAGAGAITGMATVGRLGGGMDDSLVGRLVGRMGGSLISSLVGSVVGGLKPIKVGAGATMGIRSDREHTWYLALLMLGRQKLARTTVQASCTAERNAPDMASPASLVETSKARRLKGVSLNTNVLTCAPFGEISWRTCTPCLSTLSPVFHGLLLTISDGGGIEDVESRVPCEARSVNSGSSRALL